MGSAYLFLLAAHSLWRWVVLGTGLLAIIAAWRRAAGSHTASAGRLATLWMIAVDLQLVFGVALYALSPLPGPTAGQGGEAFFLRVIHPAVMLVALGLVHGAKILGKRGRPRTAAVMATIALIGLAAAVPWSRPLLRW
ncbi:MAG: hypothetical protein H0X38_04240 [Planctomycetes bacterium]|nr:hypothetical protein [Planctomycetota bacterium]